MIRTYTSALGGVQRRAEKGSAVGHFGFAGLPRLAVALIVGCAPQAVPTEPPPPFAQPSWAVPRAAELLGRLVAIDTSTPPVRERDAALVLQDFFKREGLAAELIEATPGRSSLYLRLKGQGEAPPLLLLSHLDGAPAEAVLWPADTGPFSGVESDGAIWGRGTLDGKALAVLQAMAIVELSRSQQVLDRDVLLLVSSDGTSGRSTGLLKALEVHAEISTAGLALTLGGGAYQNLLGDGRTVHGVAYAERGWARLAVAAVAGGVGVLSPEDRVVRTVDRILVQRSRSTLTEPVEQLWQWSARDQAFPLRIAARSRLLTQLFLIEGWGTRSFTRGLVQEELRLESMVVGVDRAKAVVLGLILPGTSVASLAAELRGIAAAEDVHVQILEGVEPNQSAIDRGLLEAVRTAVAVDGAALVAPIMATEPTDGQRLRSMGIPTFGFLPLRMDQEDALSRRGRDEHVAISDLNRGVQSYIEVLFKLLHSTR